MTKECLELIYSEIKEKSQRMNMWKGPRKTKPGKIQGKYLKVTINCSISWMSNNVLYIYFLYIVEVLFLPCHQVL